MGRPIRTSPQPESATSERLKPKITTTLHQCSYSLALYRDLIPTSSLSHGPDLAVSKDVPFARHMLRPARRRLPAWRCKIWEAYSRIGSLWGRAIVLYCPDALLLYRRLMVTMVCTSPRCFDSFSFLHFVDYTFSSVRAGSVLLLSMQDLTPALSS